MAMDSYLRKGLEHFSSFLQSHGFTRLTDPELEKNLGRWGAVFRSRDFDLMFSGRGEMLVDGRPLYRSEDWYSIPEVLAEATGSAEVVPDEPDFCSLARKMDEAYPKLREFFSPGGENLRAQFLAVQEQTFLRSFQATNQGQ